MALYGYHPPSMTSPLKGKSKVQVVEYHLEHHQEFIQLMKDNLAMEKNRMKQKADQPHNERIF